VGEHFDVGNEVASSELIQRCRKGEPAAREQLFDRYRPYLRLLAQARLGRYLRAKCDPSDIVQQTLLEAHRDFAQFTGNHEGELLAWMRQILTHNLYNETRRFAAQQRNAIREVSLNQLRASLDHSSEVMSRCLVSLA
jgi:RNA polymerase sigma-70 factor (ECF subfamily)